MYRTSTVLLVGGDSEELKAFYLKEYDRELLITEGADACHFTGEKGDYTIRYIWLEKWEYNIKWLGILNHEVLHHTFQTMRDVGMEHCEHSEEAYTYFSQYIFTMCVEKLWKNFTFKK